MDQKLTRIWLFSCGFDIHMLLFKSCSDEEDMETTVMFWNIFSIYKHSVIS